MKRKLFGMTGALAVLLLALGLVLAGCPPTDSDNGGGGGETFPAAKGKLTINSIPSEKNGKYAFVSGMLGSTMLIGIVDVTGYGTQNQAMKLVKVENGKAVAPLYSADTTGTSITAYEGNDTLSLSSMLSIILLDDNDGLLSSSEMTSAMSSPDMKSITSGTFSSGNLTVTW